MPFRQIVHTNAEANLLQAGRLQLLQRGFIGVVAGGIKAGMGLGEGVGGCLEENGRFCFV
ncbi:MAG: hypothetical protein M5U34_35805 [Chloroflexi bacterium]|nr:hypothetical protein [Chloroflexota bacterium]